MVKFDFIYSECEDRWFGERLYFKENAEGEFMIINTDEELIGHLERIRVGRFMQWCLFLEDRCYLTPGCQDEVREFCRKAWGMKNG